MTTERAYFGYENELKAEIERLRSDNERLKEWCRKLIEGGTFPGEADSLRALNAALVAALEDISTRVNMENARLVARAALAKVKEGK